MSRVSSLTQMPEAQLNRWIKRVALLFVVILIAFVAFYAIDRFRLPQAPIADRQLTTLEEAVRAKPDDIVARGQLADMYAAKQRYDDAIAQYKMILDTGKANVPAQLGLGDAYRLSGQVDLAKPDYQAVIDALKDTDSAVADPQLQAAFYGLGLILLDEGKATEALPNLKNAVALKRTDADALYLLGKAQAQTGDTTTAIESLKNAIAFVPIGWADPYTALADVYTKAGDTAHAEWAGAMADVASGNTATAEGRLQAIANGPAALDAAIGLGAMYEFTGNTASAADWYRKALVIDPKNDAAILGMQRVAPAEPSAAPASPAGSQAPAESTAPNSGLAPKGDS